MFKIVPDQLKVADGWVRCGHCSDVFDATLYLAGSDSVAPVLRSESVSSAEGSVTLSSPREPLDTRQALYDDRGDGLTTPPPAVQEPDLRKARVSGGFQATDGESRRETSRAAESTNRSGSSRRSSASKRSGRDASKVPSSFVNELKQFAGSRTGASDNQSQKTPTVSHPSGWIVPGASRRVTVRPHQGSDVGSKDPLPEPGFVKQARRQAFWRSSFMRISLALTSTLLAGLLLVQWAVHERDRLAAQYPWSIPWLTGVCRPLACELGPAREIGAVVIDSSNLVRRMGNVYSFDMVLKNRAPMDIAVPALELSLTDMRDTVVSRRVFLPGEWPGSPALLPAQGSFPVSLSLSITDSGVSSMTGYRALIFYP